MGMCFRTRLLAVFIGCLIVACLNSSQNVFAFSLGDSSALGFPIENAVVARDFEQPKNPYAPGHRGTDFFAAKGTAVHSVADGRVIFAGRVARALHVTVLHGENIKSTYTFLATKTVKVGDTVKKGQLLGNTSGSDNLEKSTFLFTLRIDDRYVDPMRYLGTNSKVRQIHLGEISKPSKSMFQKFIDLEMAELKIVVGVTKPGALSEYVNWFLSTGTKTLDIDVEQIESSFKKVQELAAKIKAETVDITTNTLNGLEVKVNEGLQKLHKLEKLFISLVSETFSDMIELNKLIAQYYAQSLAYGIEGAKWFFRTVGDIAFLPLKNSLAIRDAIIDLLRTSGTTTLKLLDQYATYDLPTLLRLLVSPGSCLAWSCSQAIEMKCDFKTGFKVRDSSHYVGTTNSVMVVSGLNTRGNVDASGKLNQTVQVPVNDYGYSSEDVTYFSYAGLGKGFDKNNTYQDINVSARYLDEQIRDYKSSNPGKPLDLISHSLGGAVIGIWLADYYDPTNFAYPPIGKVVMLAPPVTGTSLASAGSEIASTDDGKKLSDLASDNINESIGAQSVTQLNENGYVDNRIASSGALKKVEVYAVRTSNDLIVSSGSAAGTDVSEVLLNEFDPQIALASTLGIAGNLVSNAKSFPSAHSDMVNDPKTISTVQHILEGTKPPCESATSALKSVMYASLVHSSEIYIGKTINNVADASAVADQVQFVNTLTS